MSKRRFISPGVILTTSNPKGCFDCEHSTSRFNSGNGAVTCQRLQNKIVSYGHEFLEDRPEECPRGPYDPESGVVP